MSPLKKRKIGRPKKSDTTPESLPKVVVKVKRLSAAKGKPDEEKKQEDGVQVKEETQDDQQPSTSAGFPGQLFEDNNAIFADYK